MGGVASSNFGSCFEGALRLALATAATVSYEYVLICLNRSCARRCEYSTGEGMLGPRVG